VQLEPILRVKPERPARKSQSNENKLLFRARHSPEGAVVVSSVLVPERRWRRVRVP
jgi:hypothetical protein